MLTVGGAVLQAIASLFVVATFFAYLRQLRAMQAQLAQARELFGQQTEAARRVAHAQTTASVAAFLHSPPVYEARRHLLSRLATVPYEQWDESDRTRARHAIGAYDIAAILARMDALPIEVLARNWGASVVKCELVGRPLISDLRKENGELWWDDFLRLAAYSKHLFPNVSVGMPPEPGA